MARRSVVKSRKSSRKPCRQMRKPGCKRAKKRCTWGKHKKGKPAKCLNKWSEAVRVAGKKHGFSLRQVRKGNKYYKLIKKEYKKLIH